MREWKGDKEERKKEEKREEQRGRGQETSTEEKRQKEGSVSVSTRGCSERLNSLQALGSTFSCFSASGKEAVEIWCRAVKDYDYNSPGIRGNTGTARWVTVKTTRHG